MSYKVLYRKYRPDSFDSVVGQDYTVSMLKNAIVSGKNAHAYIFTGPRGTGKTSSAKLFAKALNCENPVDGNPCGQCNSCSKYGENPDIIEIDAASNNGVDEIRELINNVKLVPSMSKYKVYIIDEVHMLTASAFNALLLTLEEPPSHVVFILATTDIQNVPITILSRCQRFDFKPISREIIVERLKFICSEESISYSEDGLNEIALLAAGGMRDALGMLDQLASSNSEITSEVVSSYFGSISAEKIDGFLSAIVSNDRDVLSKQLREIKMSGTNYSVFVEKLIMSLRLEAISIKNGKSKHNFLFEDIYNLIFDLNKALSDVNINVDPYLLIEIVLLKYVYKYEDINKPVINHEDFAESKNHDILKKEELSTCNKKEINKNDYNPGNKNEEKIVGNNNKVDAVENRGNSISEASEGKIVEKEKSISDINVTEGKFKVNIDVRINNCFVDCTKDCKVEMSKKMIQFMNYLMKVDRNLVSIVADTDVMAASSRYVLLSSKIDSTNDLINDHLLDLESKFFDFAGDRVRFVAISQNLWLKEVEKYRNNLKNQIKYEYIEEEVPSIENDLTENVALDTLESMAENIFGEFEIE